METIYQSLVAVEPLTLIANICNLFIQMLIIKKFFLDKIVAVLDQRRSAADKERGKAAKTEKKPSIRAQLKAAKEQTPKKQAKQKTQDLERS